MDEDVEWLSLEQASALCNRVLGLSETTLYKPLSSSRLRRSIKSGTFATYGIDFKIFPGRYYISRPALVEWLLSNLCAICGRARDEAEALGLPVEGGRGGAPPPSE
jgi:hypothetical protein